MNQIEERIRFLAEMKWDGEDKVYMYLLRDRLRDAVRLLDERDVEIEKLRTFAKLIYKRDSRPIQFSVPAWAHDAAAKLLGLPSLCHGYDEDEGSDE